MVFSHDTEHSLLCVVDLVNSAPRGGSPETLGDVEALQRFVERYRVSEIDALTQDDVSAVHRLRERVRRIFTAPDEDDAARAVNSVIAQCPVTPRLTDHDGYDWHMHYFTPGARLAEHLAIDCGIALGHVIAAGERDRLRTCEAPDCDQVLVDLSRNRSKRYCDARTCGNRLHVAAYRERRKAAAS
ncbi:MAG TPA: CGNR zinc finger domain-containing protein [Nocardioidaceae bacterium]|nr:CGNR zinc finger domain-containing protein [Nocardioidaceae bacterium]